MEQESTQKLEMPPRSLPLTGRFQLLFGGALNQIGWAIMAFSMIFVIAFSVPQTIASLFAFTGPLETASGTITQTEETSMEENEETVYKNYYTFRAKDGKRYEGVSYSTGDYPKRGARVTIEYKPTKPTISRVQGMRATPFDELILIVLLFPLVSLFIIASGLKRGLKANRLLTHGLLGYGKLIAKEETNTEVNEQTVYKLTFEFEADDGKTYQVEEKTHQTDLLEDDEYERLLYDPDNPSYAVMLDSLPGSPDIDARGRFEFSFFKGLLSLLLPALTIAIIVIFAVLNT